MRKDIFKNYWKCITNYCKVLKDYREYFDTGFRGPCLLHAFAERKTCEKALRGQLCRDCKWIEKEDKYECEKFPHGHPNVPPGSFILRMAVSDEKFVVGYTDDNGKVLFQKIYNGITTE